MSTAVACPVRFTRMPDRIWTFRAYASPDQATIGFVRWDIPTRTWTAWTIGCARRAALVRTFSTAIDAAKWLFARTLQLDKQRRERAEKGRMGW